ncbi:MAG: hypothetical protein HQ592_15360 [Planctomycetes bacterium]|nr:hypothetical protein [Planctomycetota bacterium]
MFLRNRWTCLAALAVLCLSGCLSVETVITLNPDGSGEVALSADLDRATEEQRAQIRKRSEDTNMTLPLGEAELKEACPAPHFEIIERKEDTEALKFQAKIAFKDINRLLTDKTLRMLGLKGFDFKVDGDDIVFSLKEEPEDRQMGFVPENAAPPTRRIRVVNAKTKKTVEFYQEISQKAKLADWTGRLAMKGHTIKRTAVRNNFADYPVVKLTDAKIIEAHWNIRKGFMGRSCLSMGVDVALPATDNMTYVSWSEPALLEGGYLPDAPARLPERSRDRNGEFNSKFQSVPAGYFRLPLELVISPRPVKGTTPVKVRLKALRGTGTQRWEIGTVKPNTEYTAGPLKIKTDPLKDNELAFDIEGPAEQYKGAVYRSARGNEFALKEGWRSRMGRGRATMQYEALFPLNKGTIILETFRKTEYCWLDIEIPALDFSESKNKIEAAAPPWKQRLRKELPEAFETPVPGLDDDVFAGEGEMKAFVRRVPDNLLASALIQMAAHEKMELQAWNWRRYDALFTATMRKRKGYLDAENKTVARHLFVLFGALPEEHCTNAAYLINNLRLRPFVRKEALEQVKKGNHRFARRSFFRGPLTTDERDALKGAFHTVSDAMQADGILDMLCDGDDADLKLAQEVLRNKAQDPLVRTSALHAVLRQKKDYPFELVLPYLMEEAMRTNTLMATHNWLAAYLRRESPDEDELKNLREAAEPLMSLLKDFGEQIRKFPSSRNHAKEIVTMIETDKPPK